MIATSPAADLEATKKKAELCAGCHGENGISQMENIPSLAGQPDQFIQWQLVFFRSGARKNEQMQPIAEQVDNDDIRNLGAYFASLTPPKATKPDDNPDLSQKGPQAAVGRRCNHRCGHCCRAENIDPKSAAHHRARSVLQYKAAAARRRAVAAFQFLSPTSCS